MSAAEACASVRMKFSCADLASYKKSKESPSHPALVITHILSPRMRATEYSLVITHIFLFAPEAQRILAGGETTGKAVIIAFAPWQGRRTGV
jgi:hypothetical protein